MGHRYVVDRPSPEVGLAASHSGGGRSECRRLLEIFQAPDLVDIPAFTVIFTSRGISKELLIWTLLVLPTSMAFAASVWLFLGGPAFQPGSIRWRPGIGCVREEAPGIG
jgi:hypothetical protein